MALPIDFRKRLRLPVIGAPLFIVSTPKLVTEQCKAGIVGALPALNARSTKQLDEWLAEISETLAAWDRQAGNPPAAPFAVNQIVHKTNSRWEADLALCEQYKVPVVISSLGANEELNQTVRAYGGITFHDVTTNRFAHKAVEKGAMGLIAVAAGAGGHAGRQSPFALVQEIRAWYDGPLALGGAIATGRAVLAAQALGADLAYIGSPFIATEEAQAAAAYKQAVADGGAEDIVYTDLFTGVHGNYLRASVRAAGLDPDRLDKLETPAMNWGSGGNTEAKVWKDIWGSGQGIGSVDAVFPAGRYIDRLRAEYEAARNAFPAGIPDLETGVRT